MGTILLGFSGVEPSSSALEMPQSPVLVRHGQQPPAQIWPLPTHFLSFSEPSTSCSSKGETKASGP